MNRQLAYILVTWVILIGIPVNGNAQLYVNGLNINESNVKIFSGSISHNNMYLQFGSYSTRYNSAKLTNSSGHPYQIDVEDTSKTGVAPIFIDYIEKNGWKLINMSISEGQPHFIFTRNDNYLDAKKSIFIADELAKLVELVKSGVLTQTEFEAQKAKLLSR